MFRTVFPSIIRSSKLRIQQRYMSKSCCYLLLAGMRCSCSSISSPLAADSSSCLTYTVAVYAVLSSWLWTERPSETCTAFHKNKYSSRSHPRLHTFVVADSCRQPQTYVKPETVITVFELLMISGVSLETCWAIKKHWNNKFYYTVASCWLFL